MIVLLSTVEAGLSRPFRGRLKAAPRTSFLLEHKRRIARRSAARRHEARGKASDREQRDDGDVGGWIECRRSKQEAAHDARQAPASERTEQQAEANRTKAS